MIDKRIILQGSVMVMFSILISQLPLFNYLGYEFSVAVALMLPIVVGFYAIIRFRQHFADNTVAVNDFLVTVVQAAREGLILLLLPFIVATVNIFFVKNCSYTEGVFFYLLIPVVALVWVIALGAFCFVAVRRALMLYVALVLAVLLYPLYLGYSTPQIYSYNFIYAYFPGFSYDEILRISTPFILFRGITLLVSVSLLLLSCLMLLRRTANANRHHIRAYSIALVVCGIILSCVWIVRVQLGFESSAQFIQRALGKEYTTDHFKIYYSRESFSDEEIRNVAAEHEFRFYQVATALAVSFDGRIDSYIYPDIEMKRRFIGTGNTNIAKPWRKEIHLNKDSWDDVLKHELVHVLAGEFGMPVIHAHYNIGLVEGLAMAVDHDFGNRTLEQYAAALLKFKLVSDPARLVKPVGFATQTSSVSYVMMGAFCKFLIDRYGIVHFKELYRGKSVEEVYGLSYERLSSEWERSLDRVDVPVSWRRHVEFYFKRPSIFAKECARTIADLNDRGARDLQAKKFVAAQELFHRALTTSWNTESYTGLVRAMFGASRYDSVIAILNVQMQDSVRRSGIANLFLVYGDALWYRGEYDAVLQIYQEISSLDLSPRYSEAAALRLGVLHNETLRASLAKYFVGAVGDSIAARLVDSLQNISSLPVLNYIEARIAVRQHNDDGVIHALVSEPNVFGDSVLQTGKEQLLGEAYFMKKEYQQARIHFWQSLNFTSNQASIDRVNDWLERCEWFVINAERYLR
jgi:tetratricopeptide (TPR) repeat protein